MLFFFFWLLCVVGNAQPTVNYARERDIHVQRQQGHEHRDKIVGMRQLLPGLDDWFDETPEGRWIVSQASKQFDAVGSIRQWIDVDHMYNMKTSRGHRIGDILETVHNDSLFLLGRQQLPTLPLMFGLLALHGRDAWWMLPGQTPLDWDILGEFSQYGGAAEEQFKQDPRQWCLHGRHSRECQQFSAFRTASNSQRPEWEPKFNPIWKRYLEESWTDLGDAALTVMLAYDASDNQQQAQKAPKKEGANVVVQFIETILACVLVFLVVAAVIIGSVWKCATSDF